MQVQIPKALDWLRSSESGRAWLQELPAKVEQCADRWSLLLQAPYPQAYVSWAAPARTAHGEAVVLKLQWPHSEAEHEAAALRLWDGKGAVRLLDEAPEHHALLLEHCDPGTHLMERPPEEVLEVFAALLPRLWKPAGDPFTRLEDEAADWIAQLPRRWEKAGRPFERELLDQVLEALADLSVSQDESVLLNQDLHASNVLAATREPWLAIDPKPLVGERAFSLAPIVRDYTLGHGETQVIGRLDRLCNDLGVDRERARRWALGQTLAQVFDGVRVLPHVETARWLARVG